MLSKGVSGLQNGRILEFKTFSMKFFDGRMKFRFLDYEMCLLLGSFGQAGGSFGGPVWVAWRSQWTISQTS